MGNVFSDNLGLGYAFRQRRFVSHAFVPLRALSPDDLDFRRTRARRRASESQRAMKGNFTAADAEIAEMKMNSLRLLRSLRFIQITNE